MKTTSWDQTKAILHSIGTVINQGDITTKNYVDTKISETKEYVDTEVSGTEKYIDNKISEFVGNTPVADQIAEAKSNIPESSNSFETLVTNQDGEMKWEERTHYSKLQENTVFEINFTGESEYYLEGFVPVTGQTYFVYLNGERYECVANEAPGQAGAYWNYIGSLGIETLRDYELDDRYPFFFGSMFNNPNYCCIYFKEAGEYQFIIKTLEEIVVKQLDPKFIPTASEEQLIQLLIDIDALPAMTDSNGAIFTHKDSILLI